MASPTQPSDQAESLGAWDVHAYRILTGTAVLLVGAATAIYMLLEGWGWVDSFYFSVVAVTTVGFGDITPSTDPGKLFTVGYIVAGLGVITTYLNLRFKRRSARSAERWRGRHSNE